MQKFCRAAFQSTLPTRGSDPLRICTLYALCVFQSTLPTRGSDMPNQQQHCLPYHISIHAPHEGERRNRVEHGTACGRISIHAPHEGERRNPFPTIPPTVEISIHAPHEGERPIILPFLPASRAYFNPRSPRGGATKLINDLSDQICISIHAPHEGERHHDTSLISPYKNFNPRSPRGGATIAG